MQRCCHISSDNHMCFGNRQGFSFLPDERSSWERSFTWVWEVGNSYLLGHACSLDFNLRCSLKLESVRSSHYTPHMDHAAIVRWGSSPRVTPLLLGKAARCALCPAALSWQRVCISCLSSFFFFYSSKVQAIFVVGHWVTSGSVWKAQWKQKNYKTKDPVEKLSFATFNKQLMKPSVWKSMEQAFPLLFQLLFWEYHDNKYLFSQ